MFYIKNKRKLKLATIGLSVPLMLRGFYEIFAYCLQKYGSIELLEFWGNVIIPYQNFLMVSICYIIPGALQFTSMIFAYIKQKDKKENVTLEP